MTAAKWLSPTTTSSAIPPDPKLTGHEAVVAHNSAILEEGYICGAEFLKRLKPDILIGGHSFVMDRPAKFIERYRKWSYQMRDAFRELSSEKDYRYWFDPFWVRAEPYRVSVAPGQNVEVRLHVRNFGRGRQAHRIDIHTPPGLVAEPTVIEGCLAGQARDAFPVVFKALPGASPGVHLVAFDCLTLPLMVAAMASGLMPSSTWARPVP